MPNHPEGFQNWMKNPAFWAINGKIAFNIATQIYDLSGLNIVAGEALGANLGVRFASDGAGGTDVRLPTSDGDRVTAVVPKAYAVGDPIDEIHIHGQLAYVLIGSANLTGARSAGTTAFDLTVMADGRYKGTPSGEFVQGISLHGQGGAIGDKIPAILFGYANLEITGG